MTTSHTTPAPLGARNATLADLARLLREQQARKVDIVAPATAIRARAARLVVDDTVPELGPDGVTIDRRQLHPDRGLRSGHRGQARHPRRLSAADARAQAGPVRRQRQRLAGRR